MAVHLPEIRRRFKQRSNFLVYMELKEKMKLAHYVATQNTSMSAKCLEWIKEGWKRELEQESKRDAEQFKTDTLQDLQKDDAH